MIADTESIVTPPPGTGTGEAAMGGPESSALPGVRRAMLKVTAWPALMDLQTTAAYLGISKWTLSRWLGDGLIPRPIQIDATGERKAHQRWVKETLDEFLAARSAVANGRERDYLRRAEKRAGGGA
jgi:predicted DNA-binding transcriptional regulator AlpA